MLNFIKFHIKVVYFGLLIIGVLLFVLSLFSPLMTVRSLYIFTDTITLISILSDLLHTDEWLLFILILVFTIMLPTLKYFVLFLNGVSRHNSNLYFRSLSILEFVSKWAMLDVFIVAIAITVIKFNSVTLGTTEYGLYFFVISILLSMGCVQLKKLFVELS